MKKLLSMVIAAGALLGAQAHAADEFDLKIFHVNDSHSYVEPVNTFLTIDNDKYLAQIGGMNAILNYMNTHSEGNVLRLHGGDFQTGNGTYFNYYHGRDDYEILKELKFEAMVIGNHEFDHGNDFLAELVAGLKSGKNALKVLSANLKVPFENRLTPLVDPYVILERGGEKIAVIGITSGDKVNASSKPDKGTFFTNEADTINKLVAELQKQGINKFIALTHQGVENDIPMASKVHGIDVWITADSHTIMGHQLHKLRVQGNKLVRVFLILSRPDVFKRGNIEIIVADFFSHKRVLYLQVRFQCAGHAEIHHQLTSAVGNQQHGRGGRVNLAASGPHRVDVVSFHPGFVYSPACRNFFCPFFPALQESFQFPVHRNQQSDFHTLLLLTGIPPGFVSEKGAVF